MTVLIYIKIQSTRHGLKGKILHITHPYATIFIVRLACVKHTNSVHSEPRSNSYKLNLFAKTLTNKLY